MTIEQLEALERAATPGPWYRGIREPGQISEFALLIWPSKGAPIAALERPGVRDQDEKDAEFLIALRNHAPALLRLWRAAKEWQDAGDRDVLPEMLSAELRIDAALAELDTLGVERG